MTRPWPPSRRHLLAAGLALALWPATALAQGEPQPTLTVEPLAIGTSTGTVHLLVEMARSPAEQSQGLMFRTEVPDGTGMLFVHERARPIAMWMRNTPVSLDMLFIDGQGIVRKIAAHTTPFSEAVIASPGPVAAVLEIRAGEAERLGIAEGDRVRHPLFD